MKLARTELDRGKEDIRRQILDMGRAASGAIREVAGALDHLDATRARNIAERDRQFNRQNEGIHESGVELIATQQPVASELREILAEIQVASELERIADHVADMGRIIPDLDRVGIPPVWSELLTMAERCAEMLDRMLAAYRDRDTVAAEVIAATDDDLDRMNHQIVNELVEFMQRNDSAIHNATLVIWLAHHLERIADRVTNIGEQLIFTLTGRMHDLNRSR